MKNPEIILKLNKIYKHAFKKLPYLLKYVPDILGNGGR